jgi:hypothetical protein
MLKLGSVRWRGKCAKHPGFDPRLDGRGAIRGGCERCGVLADIHDLHARMLALMRTFAQPGVAKKITPEASAHDSAQASLFGDQ